MYSRSIPIFLTLCSKHQDLLTARETLVKYTYFGQLLSEKELKDLLQTDKTAMAPQGLVTPLSEANSLGKQLGPTPSQNLGFHSPCDFNFTHG